VHTMERLPPSKPAAAAPKDIFGNLMGVRWGKMQGWEPVSAVLAPLRFGIGLTQTANLVNLDPATPVIIGGLTEALPTGLAYGRSMSAWVPTLMLAGGTMNGDIVFSPTQVIDGGVF
jgi:hypothetical protein